jgi:predicted pyridoxine 5'-phosphate oxidase superfamily flavin-nucleotide-binding protein
MSELLALKPWLEGQPFFFVGSASAPVDGACDCSYRGRQTQGTPEPLLRVTGEATLIFPDYPGNKLFNTIGNLLAHPQIALLFVDFAQQSTLLLQGQAQLTEPDAAWPSAPRTITVAVQTVQRASVAGVPHLVLKD